jgi:hypothetical protein
MPTLWLEDAQPPSLALRIQAGQRFAQGQRLVWIEPQPFCHDRRPKRQDRRSIPLLTWLPCSGVPIGCG